MVNIPVFEVYYPEWIVDIEIFKMELITGKGRTRKDVLKLMKKHNQEPLEDCLHCKNVCIQRKVEGLLKFKCFEKEKP